MPRRPPARPLAQIVAEFRVAHGARRWDTMEVQCELYSHPAEDLLRLRDELGDSDADRTLRNIIHGEQIEDPDQESD